MNIYIRISENQKSVSGEDRWDSYDKRMILKKCWVSLVTNLSLEDSLKIYHHDVSNKTLKWIENNTNNLISFKKINSIEESFSLPLTDMKLELEKEEDPNKLFALLEDDYLWKPDAFLKIKEASNYWKYFITPADTPMNYLKPKFSKIYVGLDRHWRTTSYISWNLIGCSKVFLEHINDIQNAGMNKEKLNKILQNTDCINPIPALATHCKNNDMSPLVDWNFIWRGIDI